MAREHDTQPPPHAGAPDKSSGLHQTHAIPEGGTLVLTERESAVAAREEVVARRERTARLREERVAARETMAPAKQPVLARSELEARMTDAREVNEKLVVATVTALTMTEAAKRSVEAREQFLAMLAHELRNPLAPISNALAVLQRVQTTEPMVRWAHDVIERQTSHMTRLLDDLLDVSRITSGKIRLQKRPIPVGEFMSDALEVSRPLIQSHNHGLTVHIPSERLLVDGDPTRLSQIFSNLLNNAAKYTPDGGSIVFSAEQQDNAVVLRVRDTGAGITAETMPHIFELFVQEKRSLAHSQGGLGIGLSVVSNLVVAHEGTIAATSAGPGMGSEFVVTLPLIERPLANIAHSVAAAKAGFVHSQSRLRIALIEDNVEVSDSLRMLLQLIGHEVLTAFNGTAGLALAIRMTPDVVLCDIGMPGMDGYEVVTRLRERLRGPRPLIIAISGYGRPEDHIRALAAGFDHHLVKPVDPEELMRLIDDHGNLQPEPQPPTG